MGHVILILAASVAALIWALGLEINFTWDDRMTWALLLPVTYLIGMYMLRDKD